MRLNGLAKLLARLYLKIRPGQLEKLVACARIPRAETSARCSTIKYLMCVKKRSSSIKDFLETLRVCFGTLDDSHDLLELLDRFDKAFPDLRVLEEEQAMVLSRSTASDDQKAAFTRALVRMSSELSNENLEILVALSPTPEGQKESLTSGVKLFDELQCRGCITAENTDLLDDLFRVLKLAKLTELLQEYKAMFPESLSTPPHMQPEVFPSIGSGQLPQPNLLGRREPETRSLPPLRPSSAVQRYQNDQNNRPRPLPPPQAPLPIMYTSSQQQFSQRPPSTTHSSSQQQLSQQAHLPIMYTSSQQRFSQRPPSATYSSAHEETSSPLGSVNPTVRLVRPVDARSNPKTPTPTDQRPFPATYESTPPSQFSSSGFKVPKRPMRSIHPPPVNEGRPPPHAQVYDDQTTGNSTYTPTSSGELFVQPVQPLGEVTPSAPPLPHVQARDDNSTGDSMYMAPSSSEIFPPPEQANSGPIDSGSTYTAGNSGEIFSPPVPTVNGASTRITPSAAAKGTLSAGKFPSKELNKTPTDDRFKTAASTPAVQTPVVETPALKNPALENPAMQTVSTVQTASTLESYRHESNFQSGQERQHTGEGAQVVVGNGANAPGPRVAIPSGARNIEAATSIEKSSGTVPIMALFNGERNGFPNQASPVLTKHHFTGDVNLSSLNATAKPLDQAQESSDEENGSPLDVETPPIMGDESASSVAEETNRRGKKRSREDIPEEMVGPEKRHQPAREAKSYFASFKNLFGFK